MPNQPSTPHRTIRVTDDLWTAAQRKSGIEGRTLTHVIVDALRDYVASPIDPETITATYSVPDPDERARTGWNWADAATDAWIATAASVGLDATVHSEEVDDPNTQAAIIEIAGRRYVVIVSGDQDDQDVVVELAEEAT